ncbi:MAG: arsenate reductase ArsC [Rhodothermales bacterium]
MSKLSVLFICTHNSARSQMAEGLLRDRYDDRYEIYSAGTEQTHVRPLAIEVMEEIGIDISDHTSKTIDAVSQGRTFDVVVTVCDHARDACPYVPARRKNLHQSFEDPSAAQGSPEERRAVFRRVRDEIADWIDQTFAPGAIEGHA